MLPLRCSENPNVLRVYFIFFFFFQSTGTSDVLNDIGNMLADLTDELDSMLEEESGTQPMRQKS